MDVERRIGALRDRLDEAEADVLLVGKVSNVAYLTGLMDVFDENADVVCAITADDALLFTSFIYAKPARPRLSKGPWTLHEVSGDFYVTVCSELASFGAQMLAVEASIPYGRFRFISEHSHGRVAVVDQWVEDVRVLKEPAEVERIAAAAALADAGFEYILERVQTGRTEREIALDVEVFLRSNGSEGVPFAPIVASGPNSANPHATASDRALTAGDALKMDFGARIDGYCSDLTRTVAIGQADERLREMHEAVLAANQAAIAATQGGIRASDLDAVARTLIEERGFGEAFGHGLGHGVGLDVHEAPRVGPRIDASIHAGACLTIEPGVYVDGFAGVRIEDLVEVTGGGCRVLSAASRELFEL